MQIVRAEDGFGRFAQTRFANEKRPKIFKCGSGKWFNADHWKWNTAG